jgi:flagellar hook-associated protein 3 FlgL
MRISTSVYMNAAMAGIREQQAGIARLSAQLAADKRILQPKDDPIAASRAMELSASIAQRTQFAANQQQAQVVLNHEQTVLEGLAGALDRVRGILLGGVSAANDLALRQRYAAEMAGLYQEVKDLANMQDSSGRFIFAGYRETAASLLAPNTQAPFEHTQTATAPANAASYGGDANTRSVLIDRNIRLKVTDDLDSTVMRAGDGVNLDLLQTLDQIVIDLNDPNVTQATLNTRMAAIQTAIANLQLIEADVAARQVQLTEVSSTNTALLNLDKDALGKLQELDQAAAIVQLRQRETALQAAEQAFARTAELNLFSFL